MEQDFFTYIPPEITMNILLRLPVRTAVSCKCVRKSWRSLIETPEFVESYKSVPSLAIFEGETCSIPYKVYELEDELNLENFRNPCNVAFNFSFPQPKFIESSANGLLLLSGLSFQTANLCICNPVTREYINLPDPFVPQCVCQWEAIGFGVSKTTGQYKLISVLRDRKCPFYETEKDFICQVYTLGTGLWRSTSHRMSLNYVANSVGALLNGNIHWLAYDWTPSPWISYFDLETELFSTFSPPNLDAINSREGREGYDVFRSLCALRDCLGLCENSKNQLVVGLMNTYGDEKSWTKHFVIAKTGPYDVIFPICEDVCIFKEFKDGEIMMKGCYGIICFSIKTNTIQKTNLVGIRGRSSIVCYTPSFLRLKTFAMENVSSF